MLCRSSFTFIPFPRRVLSLRAIVLAFVLIALIVISPSLLRGDAQPDHSRWSWSSESTVESGEPVQHDGQHDPVCASFANFDRVVISVKTGATEASLKVPTQMLTSLRCAPHVFLFSDMEQTIGDRQVFNVLDTIPDSVKDGNSDFELYRKQQELRDPEKIISSLRSMRDPRRPEDRAGWTLDKYKQLHVVERTWALRPDMDWYFHIEADTYLVWSSLIAWLQRLDSSKELFFGSLSYIIDLPFAHGGSGMLLSRAAMHNFAVRHSGTAARWDAKIHDNCCGDWVFAQVLKEYGMDLKNSWPTINGETPATVPFDSDHWCQPLVTMHHISPAEAQQLGDFEQQRRNKSEPLLYSELFKHLVSDLIPDHLENWDNMSDDKALPEITTAEDYRKACAENANCFQSLYKGDECILGTKRIIFGAKHDPEQGKNWQSTWNKTRIAGWASKQPPCDPVTFPFEYQKWK